MKSALIAMVLGLFTVSFVAQANETAPAAGDTQAAAPAKKHTKKKTVKKDAAGTTTTTEEKKSEVPADAAPAN